MATNATRDHYQAFLIPDDRITVWEEECSNLDETMGGHVDQPVEADDQQSEMSLRCLRRSRAPGTTHDDVTITTQSSGLPSVTSTETSHAGTFTWSPDGGTTVMGHSPEHVLTGYRVLKPCDGTGTELRARYPTACVTAANTAVVAFGLDFAGTSKQLRVCRLVQGGDDWTYHAVLTGLDEDVHPHPCLMPLANGRLVLYYWTVGEGAYGAERLTIAALYSDDDGVTWDVYAESVLPEALDVADYEGQQIQAAAAPDGRVMLLAQLEIPGHTNAKVNTWQYGSLDYGISFIEVAGEADDTSIDARACAAMVHTNGFWVVAYLSFGADYPYVKRAASPFVWWMLGDQASLTSFGVWDSATFAATKLINALGMAMCADESGKLFLYTVDTSTYPPRGASITYSQDSGISWQEGAALVAGSERWFLNGESETSPANIAAVCHEGRVHLVHDREATGSEGTGHEGSISVAYLGGYENVTAPKSGESGWLASRVNYVQPWLPYHLPTDDDWTATGTIDTEEIDGTGVLHLAQAGASTTYYYTEDAPDEDGHGYLAMATLDTRAAVATSLQTLFFEARFTNDVNTTCGIRISQSGTTIYAHRMDTAGTFTQIASAAITPTTNGVGFVVPIAYKWVVTGSRKAKVWWRYATDAAVNPWTLLVSTTTLPNIWASATTGRLLFGVHLDTGMEAWFNAVHYSSNEDGRAEDLFDQDEDTIGGRAYSTTATYVTDSIVLQAAGGVTVPGESWTIGTAWDYAAANLLLGNPRRGWRSRDTATEIKLAFRLSEDGNEVMPTDVLGIGLIRSNIGKFQYELYDDDTNTWSAPVTVDVSHGDLRWTRKGGSVAPSTSSHSGKITPLIRESEWDGAQLVMGSGKTRLIRRCRGGKWTNATTAKPVLYFAGEDGTEGASGTVGRIIPRDSVVLISLRGSVFSAIRITIPVSSSAYAAAEGYWRAGSIVIGSVYAIADETDDNRVVETTSRREVIAYDDGTVASRILGPPARVVTVSWTDGVDTRMASEDSDDPAYHTLDAGGSPLGLSGTTPWDDEGIYARLSTLENDSIIYLPRVVAFDGTPTPQVINRRAAMVYGRIQSDGLRLETAQGNESVDEVIRVGVVTIGELG